MGVPQCVRSASPLSVGVYVVYTFIVIKNVVVKNFVQALLWTHARGIQHTS